MLSIIIRNPSFVSAERVHRTIGEYRSANESAAVTTTSNYSLIFNRRYPLPKPTSCVLVSLANGAVGPVTSIAS